MKKIRKKRTNEEFIKEFNLVHNNFYNYEKTSCKKLHDKIIITCPVHGDVEVETNHHLRGTGCRWCAFEKNHENQRDTTDSFIEKARKLHGNIYDYSKVSYGKNAHEKIIVVCPIHGDILISPNSHLVGSGCKQCNQVMGWTKTAWKNACKNDIPEFYIIKCSNENESFYKIGITCKTVERRYGFKSQMPYKWEVIKRVSSENCDEIFSMEREFKKLNTKLRYKPSIRFGGDSECYSSLIIN